MSRAVQLKKLVNEAVLHPQAADKLAKDIEISIRRWLSEQTGDIVDTYDLVIYLNRKYITTDITFVRQKNNQHNSPSNLFTGEGSLSPQDEVVYIHVNPQINLKLVQRTFGYEMRQLRSVLYHEMVHKHQGKKELAGLRQRDPDAEIPPRMWNFRTMRYERGNLVQPRKSITGMPIPYPKTMSRTSQDKHPNAKYLGTPEEIMAHARSVYEYLTSRSDARSKYQAERIIGIYMQLGTDHPAYKRFMKYLVDYMQAGRKDMNILHRAVASAAKYTQDVSSSRYRNRPKVGQQTSFFGAEHNKRLKQSRRRNPDALHQLLRKVREEINKESRGEFKTDIIEKVGGLEFKLTFRSPARNHPRLQGIVAFLDDVINHFFVGGYTRFNGRFEGNVLKLWYKDETL